MAQDEKLHHVYENPIFGHTQFVEYSTHLLLGQNLNTDLKDNVVAVQTVSAIGALRLGFEFAAKSLGLTDAIVGNPSWTDYAVILQNAGIPNVREYPYWDFEKKQLDFDAMVETLKRAEPR